MAFHERAREVSDCNPRNWFNSVARLAGGTVVAIAHAAFVESGVGEPLFADTVAPVLVLRDHLLEPTRFADLEHVELQRGEAAFLALLCEQHRGFVERIICE